MRNLNLNGNQASVLFILCCLQDRKLAARVPISASDVAIMLESAGIDRLLAVDLHCGQIQARVFFRASKARQGRHGHRQPFF